MINDRPPTLESATPNGRSASHVARAGWAAWRADVTLLVATLLVAGAVAMADRVRGVGERHIHLMLYSLYALPASVALLASVSRPGTDGRGPRRATRAVCGLVAAVVAIGMIRVHSCPHATYLDVGAVPIPIAGRACGNVQPVVPF